VRIVPPLHQYARSGDECVIYDDKDQIACESQVSANHQAVLFFFCLFVFVCCCPQKYLVSFDVFLPALADCCKMTNINDPKVKQNIKYLIGRRRMRGMHYYLIELLLLQLLKDFIKFLINQQQRFNFFFSFGMILFFFFLLLNDLIIVR